MIGSQITAKDSKYIDRNGVFRNITQDTPDESKPVVDQLAAMNMTHYHNEDESPEFIKSTEDYKKRKKIMSQMCVENLHDYIEKNMDLTNSSEMQLL